MKLVCCERLDKEDNWDEGQTRYDYNVYYELDDDSEETVIKNIFAKFFPKLNYSFTKRSNLKELCVFLPDMSHNRALEFSKNLRRKINNPDSRPLQIDAKTDNLQNILPKKTIGVVNYQGQEVLAFYSVSESGNLEIQKIDKKTKYFRTKIKSLLEGN